jgi:hypothetical protein
MYEKLVGGKHKCNDFFFWGGGGGGTQFLKVF